jgi:prevent-host-death family protein
MINTQKRQNFSKNPYSVWQLQAAKAMLSEVIKKTRTKPQIITVRGEETAAILSIEEYRKLTGSGQSLYQFIQDSPLRDLELELPLRLPEETRGIEL